MKHFKSPTLDEVALQAAKTGLTPIEGEKFFYFYESKGWMVGKSKMKNWLMAMAGWKIRSQTNGQPNNNLSGADKIIMQKEYERVLERMKTIRNNYGEHQSWTEGDKREFGTLKSRKVELMGKLDIRI